MRLAIILKDNQDDQGTRISNNSVNGMTFRKCVTISKVKISQKFKDGKILQALLNNEARCTRLHSVMHIVG